jgi:adenylate kinase
VPQEVMLERCMKRAETSGRADDNAETIKKRVQNYFDQSYPVIEYYKKFGKVRKIDATGDISEVYAQTKEAILPQTMFVLGPKCSGKSEIAKNLADRTNMTHIVFDDFVKENDLADEDDETVTMALIKRLSIEIKPRVVLENFPQNKTQAKFFIRNCKKPSNVFSLSCSKDVCQERMVALGETNPRYVPSAVLSQKIKSYYETAKELLPYLEQNTPFVSVNTENSFEKTMDDINCHIEPCVIHIRPGANSNILRKEITERLSTQHGFIDLDINGLIRDENERKTAIGIEMHQMVQSNRIIPAEMIVRMLKKIIYSGQVDVNKFILTSFPDIIEQAKEFELNCSKIAAIIYATTDDSIVEIKNNNLSLFNIDSLFQKEFRLKTMSEWDFNVFNEKLGNKTDFGIIVGRPLSGKSTLAQYMAKNLGYKVVDMKAITEKVKGMLGTEDEPFEGEVPIAKVEE